MSATPSVLRKVKFKPLYESNISCFTVLYRRNMKLMYVSWLTLFLCTLRRCDSQPLKRKTNKFFNYYLFLPMVFQIFFHLPSLFNQVLI